MDGSDAKSSASKSTTPTPDISALGDDELLQMRICDLKLKIAGTELESRIEKFYAELAAKDIAVKPLCYLGDEWFCPEGSRNHRDPVLSCSSTLKEARRKHDDGSRGRHRSLVHAAFAARDGPCVESCLSARKR